ncbi:MULTISPECIES: circadian clock protein KaiA [Moorena]|uniref:Circadian clock oscillator protein KaiA n=3 Tax=Moorena TaxID=1155738 RepID=F4XPZ7_9CYAN|nr:MULTISPECIES: circadian clock protein KaiA [Moorena]EGJ33364.1 KaiA domain protein [Moorena producens 3L]
MLLSQLTICTLISSDSLAQSLSQVLGSEQYIIHSTSSESEFFEVVEQHKQDLDCLVLQDTDTLPKVIHYLYLQGTTLPAVFLRSDSPEIPPRVDSNQQLASNQTTDKFTARSSAHLFHPAEVELSIHQLPEIGDFIQQAMTEFLSLAPACNLPRSSGPVYPNLAVANYSFLSKQQHRLAEKLRERLGYLGVYYKRNPRLFFRNLSLNDRDELLEHLRSQYRQIVLQYFAPGDTLNQDIDHFVEQVFFADISISKIVEIHMELMDEFSKQLQLEGRREDILLDYRLTLIDVIAHLGEMYRRSIPREL